MTDKPIARRLAECCGFEVREEEHPDKFPYALIHRGGQIGFYETDKETVWQWLPDLRTLILDYGIPEVERRGLWDEFAVQAARFGNWEYDYRAEHHPECDGSCKRCPVQVPVDPSWRVGVRWTLTLLRDHPEKLAEALCGALEGEK